MPGEPLGAPENLSKEAPGQEPFGQLDLGVNRRPAHGGPAGDRNPRHRSAVAAAPFPRALDQASRDLLRIQTDGSTTCPPAPRPGDLLPGAHPEVRTRVVQSGASRCSIDTMARAERSVRQSVSIPT